ncbi:Citrate lyase subunit beta-like protein [compost metagenome]
MGMGGMLCIHPSHLAPINQVHQPQEADVMWARRLIDVAAGQPGAFRFEGKMIDAPVLERALRLLSECR